MQEDTIEGFHCNVQAPFEKAGAEIRMTDAKVDFVFPEVPFPSNKIFATMGAQAIEAMVVHHHTLLRKSAIGELFPSDDAVFAHVTHKTAEFFIEALGGAQDFSTQYGHPALRERHFRFLIDEKARDIWLMLYKKTLKDIAFPTQHLEEFWNWIEALSIRMINRRTTFETPKRYPFASIAHEFTPKG